MINLITANACLAALKKDGIVYSKSYFPQMVNDGKIPHHAKPPSPKKFFYYDEVKTAIEDHKDPTRDAQREANEKRRKEEPDLMSLAGSYESQADMTQEEKEALRKEQEELKKLMADVKSAAGDTEDTEQEMTDFGGMPTAQIRLFKEFYMGKLAKLEFEKKKGEVISIEEVKNQVFQAYRTVRDGMLGIPTRLSSRLAYETDPHTCRTMMEEEINRQLSSLSGVFSEF